MEGHLVQEDVGEGSEAEVEEGEEDAKLVVPLGRVPTDGEEHHGMGRETMLEEGLGGGETVAIEQVEEHVWLHIATGELGIETL